MFHFFFFFFFFEEQPSVALLMSAADRPATNAEDLLDLWEPFVSLTFNTLNLNDT